MHGHYNGCLLGQQAKKGVGGPITIAIPGDGRSPSLLPLPGRTPTARHVPGVLNIVADALSRPHSVLLTEGTLSHRVLCGPHCGRWVRLHLSGLLSRTRFDPVLMLSTLVVGVTGFSGALTTLFVQLTLREYNSPSF